MAELAFAVVRAAAAKPVSAVGVPVAESDAAPAIVVARLVFVLGVLYGLVRWRFHLFPKVPSCQARRILQFFL
jgi:hypothetical protein